MRVYKFAADVLPFINGRKLVQDVLQDYGIDFAFGEENELVASAEVGEPVLADLVYRLSPNLLYGTLQFEDDTDRIYLRFVVDHGRYEIHKGERHICYDGYGRETARVLPKDLVRTIAKG